MTPTSLLRISLNATSFSREAKLGGILYLVTSANFIRPVRRFPPLFEFSKAIDTVESSENQPWTMASARGTAQQAGETSSHFSFGSFNLFQLLFGSDDDMMRSSSAASKLCSVFSSYWPNRIGRRR